MEKNKRKKKSQKKLEVVGEVRTGWLGGKTSISPIEMFCILAVGWIGIIYLILLYIYI